MNDGLARKEWRAFLGLCGFGLEAAWAFVSQGRMSPDGIIEAVDIAANGIVGSPFLVGAISGEILVQHVWGGTVGGFLEPTPLHGVRAVLTHQPGDAMPPDSDPIFAQFHCHAGGEP